MTADELTDIVRQWSEWTAMDISADLMSSNEMRQLEHRKPSTTNT